MSLEGLSWIPKQYRTLMMTTRDYDPEKDDVDDMVLRDFQKEAMMQDSFNQDKIKSVKRNAERIEKTKGHLKLARKDARRMLNKQLEQLQAERFELLKDEILNACKNPSGGLLDTKKLVTFHQKCSNKKERRKPKNKES